MATVRKWEGRLIVTGDTTNIPPFHSHRMTLVVTPEEAITLARELRDAADPWSVDACIEWMKEHWNITVYWKNGVVDYVAAGGRFCYSHQWSDTATGLRELVHVVAARRGIDCPLGDLCAICHPPAPPVPSDEELAKMGTEELIEWIHESGRTVQFRGAGVSRDQWWIAFGCEKYLDNMASSTLLGLAKKVAKQLREAKPDGQD